jgi:predicted nucleic acid-binding protein
LTVPARLLYLHTSAVLRATLESGTSPEVEQRIRSARVLPSSRLSLVESCRALMRLRALGVAEEDRLADAERAIAAIWARCELWEITRRVCERACEAARGRPLRALDAIHLATFVLARRELEGLEMLTVDERLQAAVTGHHDVDA